MLNCCENDTTISSPPGEESPEASGLLMDPEECLRGIRRAYFATSNIEDDDEVDPETIRRITQVEEDLLAILKTDESLDPEQVLAKAKQTSSSVAESLVPLAEISALHSKHAFPCSDTNKTLPSNPTVWPQSPLMIRPTPNTSTKIRGIRRAKSLQYEHFSGFCAGCILPLNCGSEAPGDSLVVDFESTHFVGTMLMRIKQAKRLENSTTYSEQSYFDGKKRKFQAVVKGRFRTPLPMSEAVTGQTFDRPAGKLPARWIVTSFIKFVSSLAPQLEAKLDGNSPRFLTPLVATAHTVLQRPASLGASMSTDLEDEVEEVSSTNPASVLPLALEALGTDTDTSSMSTSARMKARKRAFNQLAAHQDKALRFDTEKEYTFEFYQHLVDFGAGGLAVDMGRPIGKVGLSHATDGQPLKFMSAHKDPTTGQLDTLWSFDIWHASLYPFAEKALHESETMGK